MLFSWVLFTNHCALGELCKNPVAAKMHRGCCGGQTSPVGEKDPGVRECCKTLNVLPVHDVVKVEKGDAEPLVCFLAVALDSGVKLEGGAIAHETGPPRAGSFAETVLQHSLLSHAPPVMA